MTDWQMCVLRGLAFAEGRWVSMSATEQGNVEVSELHTRGLVEITFRMNSTNGRELHRAWRITDEGRAVVNYPVNS